MEAQLLRKMHQMERHTPLLQSKLKSYSMMAGSLLAVSQLADAQIIHHQLPDTTFNENQTGLSFDLNNDGNTDYTFFLIKSDAGSQVNHLVGGFASNLNNEIVGTAGTGSYVYPLAMQAGETIGGDLDWQAYGSVFWVFAQQYSSGAGTPVLRGNWRGETEKFAGLRLDVDGEKYYGWLRMDVDSFAGQFTIKDYAYQSIPDSFILAGDTDLIISSIPTVSAENHISMIVHENNVVISVPTNDKSDLTITIINMSGAIVKQWTTKERKVQVSLTELPQALYLVNARTTEAAVTKKISHQ